MLVYIQQHLDEAVALEDLARVAHFSPYHFHRLFRGMVGESVMEHVRRLRLERAAHRLKFSDQPVTRIAFDAGYETHEAFTRAFRAMFDQSPSEFRQAHRTVPYRNTPSGVHFSTDGKVADFQPGRTAGQTMDASVEGIDPMRVAFVRHVGPYSEVGAAWETLMGWAGRRGLLKQRPKILGVVLDDPEITPADRIRYDACLVVEGRVEPEGDVGVQAVAGGDHAVATHRGPYDKLGETYAWLCGEWIPASGREMRFAPAFEVYHNSPGDAAPADLRTEVCVPLEG